MVLELIEAFWLGLSKVPEETDQRERAQSWWGLKNLIQGFWNHDDCDCSYFKRFEKS